MFIYFTDQTSTWIWQLEDIKVPDMQQDGQRMLNKWIIISIVLALFEDGADNILLIE